MSKNSHSTPTGLPPQPASPGHSNAGHDDDNKSVSSQRIRKLDKFVAFFRSSSQDRKAKNTGITSLKSSIKEASAASIALSAAHRLSTLSIHKSADIEQAVSTTAVKSTPSMVHPSTMLTKLRLDVFPQNVNAPVFRIPLPEIGARIDSTPQLALCIGLLSKVHDTIDQQAEVSQEPSFDTTARLASAMAMRQNPTERERIFWLGARMVDEFAKDAFKNSTEIAEMVLIGPVMDKEHYRRVLSSIIAAFDHSVVLSVDLLQGLVQLVQSAPPKSLLSDDLVKILRLLRLRLQDTLQQSTAHPYHLTLAISRVLDIMADHKVKDTSRVEEHEPLSGVLSSLTGSSDPYLMYQACYAFEALQYVSDDETVLQAVLRQSIGVAGGLVKISAVMKLDLDAVLEGLGKLQEVLVSTAEVAGAVYEGFCSLMESSRGVFDSLKEGYGSSKKRPWYAAVRAAHAFAQAGQLQDLNRLIYEAPCRREPLFQWGICQLLSEIASDDIWDTFVRQQAVELLGGLFQNDPDWGQDESVRTWMLNISGQLGAVDDATVSSTGIAMVNEHQQYQLATIKLPYPLRSRLPLPTTSPTLAKVQKSPPLEYDLHRLRMLMLKKNHQDVYIPPLAKPSLKARDEDTFLLMDKVKEFLAGGRQVMLVLGDSGAGKSTFNRHLEHRLWTDYKSGDPIPLFINLPAIDRPDQGMIAKQFKIHSFSEDQIMDMKLHRQLILICDGYDESQQLANLYDTNMLSQPGQWNTKMIISCRTQFLGPEYHSRFMPQGEGGHYEHPAPHLFQEAVIAPFSKVQIENYVEQYVPLEPRTWGTKDYMDRLTTIPNLLDLVRNPFLLSLALEALPGVTEGKEDLSTIKITRAQLYDIFVSHWLDVNKRRLERNNALSIDDRDMLNQLVNAGFSSLGLDYATKLARAIFDRQNGKPVVKYIHLSDKNTWKAEFFGPQSEIRLLRESSPLTRAGNQFRFMHRSMLEYFLSRAIYNPVKTDNEGDEEDDFESSECPSPSLLNEGPLFRRNLLTEPSIIQFLCDRVKSSLDFEQQLRTVINLSKTNAGGAIAATNAITILVRAGVSFNGADLRGVKIPRADLSGGHFDSAQFQRADLTGVDLSRSWLRQVDLSRAQLKDVRFGELPYLEVDSTVRSCIYSLDGTMLAAGLEEDGLDIYSTTSWIRVLQIRGTGGVLSVVFSPDSQQIAFGGRDETVRVWNLTSSVELLAMKGHTGSIYSVDYSPYNKRIASASYDETVRLWSSQNGESLFVLKGHTSAVTSIKFSPDGRQLVSGSWDTTIRFWDPETGERGCLLRSSLELVDSLAYSSDGKWIVSGYYNGTLQLWDAVSNEPGPVLQGHTSEVLGVAFSPNSQWIASASTDKTVRLWDASKGTPILILSGHNEPVRNVAFSPNGAQIVSGGDDMKVRLWDLSSRWSSIEPQRYRVDSLLKAAYTPDGLSILTASDRCVQQWDSMTGRSLPKVFHFPKAVSVTAVEFSPDGNQIAAIVKGDVHLWNRRACAAGSVFKHERYRLLNVVYSPCGRWVAAFKWGETIWLWDLHITTDREHHVLIELGRDDRCERRSVTFSSAGHQLVIGFSDGSIRAFDPRSGNLLSSLQLAPEGIGALAYSPTSQQLAIGGGDSLIYLWDGQSQEPAIKLNGHNASVQSIAYSPCGQWITSGSEDRTVRLWRRQQEGESEIWLCTGVVRSFFDFIRDIVWNPVIPMEFVTHCDDQSLRVWRISINGESVLVRMLWGFDIENLWAEGLICKDATDLSLMNQKLLVQRGAVDRYLALEGEGLDT